MPPTATKVRSQFYHPDAEEDTREDEFAAWAVAHPKELRRLDEQEGSVFVIVDGEEAQFGDLMVNLIPALCFDAVVGLLSADELSFPLYNSETIVYLRREGETIEFASTVCNPVRAPRRPVLEALVACGERFIVLAEQVWGKAPTDVEIIDALKASGAAARAALNAAFPV